MDRRRNDINRSVSVINAGRYQSFRIKFSIEFHSTPLLLFVHVARIQRIFIFFSFFFFQSLIIRAVVITEETSHADSFNRAQSRLLIALHALDTFHSQFTYYIPVLHDV